MEEGGVTLALSTRMMARKVVRKLMVPTSAVDTYSFTPIWQKMEVE